MWSSVLGMVCTASGPTHLDQSAVAPSGSLAGFLLTRAWKEMLAEVASLSAAGADCVRVQQPPLAVRTEPFDKAVKYSLSAVLFSVRSRRPSASPSWDTRGLHSSVAEGSDSKDDQRAEGFPQSPKENAQVSTFPPLACGTAVLQEQNSSKDAQVPSSPNEGKRGVAGASVLTPSVSGDVLPADGHRSSALSPCEGTWTGSSERFSGSSGCVYENSGYLMASSAESENEERTATGGCRAGGVEEGSIDPSGQEGAADMGATLASAGGRTGSEKSTNQPESVEESSGGAGGAAGDTSKDEQTGTLVCPGDTCAVGPLSPASVPERRKEGTDEKDTRRPESSTHEAARAAIQQAEEAKRVPAEQDFLSHSDGPSSGGGLQGQRQVEGSMREERRRHHLTCSPESLSIVSQSACPSFEDSNSPAPPQSTAQGREVNEPAMASDRMGGTDRPGEEAREPAKCGGENDEDAEEKKSDSEEESGRDALDCCSSGSREVVGEHESQQSRSSEGYVCKEQVLSVPVGPAKKETEASAPGISRYLSAGIWRATQGASLDSAGKPREGPAPCAKAKREEDKGQFFLCPAAEEGPTTSAVSSSAVRAHHPQTVLPDNMDSSCGAEWNQSQSTLLPSFCASSPPRLLSGRSCYPHPEENAFSGHSSDVKPRTESCPLPAGTARQVVVLDGSADGMEILLGRDREGTQVSTGWVGGSAASFRRSESLSAVGRCSAPGRQRQVPMVADDQEEHLLLYVK